MVIILWCFHSMEYYTDFRGMRARPGHVTCRKFHGVGLERKAKCRKSVSDHPLKE